MKFDLQDWWRANPKAFLAGAAVIAAAFAALVVSGVTGSNSSKHTTTRAAVTTSTTTGHHSTATSPSTTHNGVTTPSAGYHPAYAKNTPQSPADQKFAASESGQQTALAEAVTPASPAWTHAYPAVPADDRHSEQGYTVAFLQELLDRRYSHQTRQELASWVSAETAEEMLPGIPRSAGDKVLFAELITPGAIHERPGAVPGAAQWAELTRGGVTQRAYGIFVHPDAQWQTLKSDGLTTPDPLLDTEDATGTLEVTRRGHTTQQHFSIQLIVGSALHHPGYGVAGIDQWTVN